MVAKRVAGVAGSAAGSAAGGLLNNPGAIAAVFGITAIVSLLLIFRKDISGFFGGLKFPEFPEIKFPEFPDITFPDFPDINIEFPDITFPDFPDFPDFESLFQQFFNQFFNGGGDEQIIPGETDEGVTFPPGCTVTPEGIIDCPTPPTFDVCDDFPELCEPCGPNEERIGGICQPVGVTPPPIDEEPSTLPPGFTFTQPDPSGMFGGGFIFERDPCFMSLSEIIDAGLASSASEAANVKAIACSGNVTEEPSDLPDFEPTPTPESEARRAACTSCDLFGLNCPICRGEIGA